MPNILDIDKLCVNYSQGVKALKGVSLSLPEKSRLAIIGPNGAGKTSLQLAVMGGLKYTGTIRLDGVDLSARNGREIRSRCGMIFENPDDQLFMPTLLEDVAFGPLNQGFSSAHAVERSRQAIASVGLAGLEGRCAHHLSAGQKRNASLATVLSMNVKLLLLDEPTAGLDFRSRRRLIEILTHRPESMVLATHDMDLVKTLCDRVVLLDDGQVAAEGATADVLGDQGLLRAHGLA
jgi:cobalt/nickel transport system ATP-binding protein